MRILIIDDDPDFGSALAATLKSAGYVIDTARDGERGCFLARTNSYSLIILDYNLPLLSGREIIKMIREENLSVPIIMVSVNSELNDKVDLLTLGADDYLTKPFALSELLARVKALLRRPVSWQKNILKLEDLELDADKFLVTKNGQRINLSSKEFALLEYFLANPGRILSRQQIMEHVWDENADPFSNTIEVHIMNLRKKVETPDKPLIFTIPNRGYKIDSQK